MILPSSLQFRREHMKSTNAWKHAILLPSSWGWRSNWFWMLVNLFAYPLTWKRNSQITWALDNWMGTFWKKFTLWIILLSFTNWQSFTMFILSMSRENKNWFMVIEDIVLAPSWLLIKTRMKDLVKTVKVWIYRRFAAPKTLWNLLRYSSRWERTVFNYNPKGKWISGNAVRKMRKGWLSLFPEREQHNFILVSSTWHKNARIPVLAQGNSQ